MSGGEPPQWLLLIFESDSIILLIPHMWVAAKFISTSLISSKRQQSADSRAQIF